MDKLINDVVLVCLRLREARKACGLTQKELANTADCSPRTVMSWEKNIPIPSDKLSLMTMAGLDGGYVITGIWSGGNPSGSSISQDVIKGLFDAEQAISPVMSKHNLPKTSRFKAILAKTYLDSFGSEESLRLQILDATAMALAAAQG
jgi:DNA-binding XRE family transcriptional regulator